MNQNTQKTKQQMNQRINKKAKRWQTKRNKPEKNDVKGYVNSSNILKVDVMP